MSRYKLMRFYKFDILTSAFYASVNYIKYGPATVWPVICRSMFADFIFHDIK